MNSHTLAHSAYAGAARPTRSDRSTEYDLFARVTRSLGEVRGLAAGYGALARAIHDNRRLWTALAADVAIETNPLPRPLRAQIFYLSEFTAQHSRKVLAGDASVDVLIDINTAVMRGLRGEGAAR